MKTCVVIFGVTGDLSRRKLLPALYKIRTSGYLTDELSILGITRREVTLDELYSEHEHYDAAAYANLREHAGLFKMDLDAPNDYHRLKQKLEGDGYDQIVMYLSVPPFAVQGIIGHLGRAGLNGQNLKLLIEKPFGTDFESANELIERTQQYFGEQQVYRIDHYLAKEMAQNIMVFRSSNALFERVWSGEYIDRIEITASEKLGVGWRADFYEQTGALVDIIQSHLLQLLALTIMDIPSLENADKLSTRRLAALESLRLPPANQFDGHIIRAQYEGYQSEVKNPGSTTETFARVTLYSDTPQWRGVPFILTTGKQLADKFTTIEVYFKENHKNQADRLTFRIQPKEGVEFDLWVKKPGYAREVQLAALDFSYENLANEPAEAYEQVLIDAITSDKSLFASKAEVLSSWKLLGPVQAHWQLSPPNGLASYKKKASIAEILHT